MSEQNADARAHDGTKANRKPRLPMGVALNGAMALTTMHFGIKCWQAHAWLVPDDALVEFWGCYLLAPINLLYNILMGRLMMRYERLKQLAGDDE